MGLIYNKVGSFYLGFNKLYSVSIATNMNKDEKIKAIEELNKEIIESRLMKKKETIPDRISRVLRFFPFRMNEWNHYHNVSKKKKMEIFLHFPSSRFR